jgi:hypothetical protein
MLRYATLLSYCFIIALSFSNNQPRSEAAAKGIKLAAHYSRFFDLRVEFAQMHKGAHANNLTSMLSCIHALLYCE